MFVLPRAIEAVFSLIGEKFNIQPIKNGYTYLQIINVFIISYNYLLETHNMTPKFYKSLDLYTQRTPTETQLLDAMRENVRLTIKETYRHPRISSQVKLID